jgi:hypothetical protein
MERFRKPLLADKELAGGGPERELPAFGLAPSSAEAVGNFANFGV